MVSTLIIAVVAVSLLGVIGGAIGVRKLIQLQNGGSTSSGSSNPRRRQSKGAPSNSDDQE